MNPFENVKAFAVNVSDSTAVIQINLNQYPQVATKEAIDAGMAFYVEKHHPNIHSWEARRQGDVLVIYVKGNINTSVLFM